MRRTPLTPIFDYEPRRGSIVVGNTPGTSPPLVPIDTLLWNFNHVYWAEGPEFVALGLSDTDPVSTFPDEASISNLTSSGADRPIYTASVAALNSKPALAFNGSQYLGGVLGFVFTSAAVNGWWEIVIANNPSLTTSENLSDGNASSGRVIVTAGTTGGYAIFAGVSQGAGTATTGMHGFAANFQGVASGLIVDGTPILTGIDAGSNVRSGVTLGDHWQRAGTISPLTGHIAFYGFWEGDDITAEAWWPDFVAAINAHYGATLFA